MRQGWVPQILVEPIPLADPPVTHIGILIRPPGDGWITEDLDDTAERWRRLEGAAAIPQGGRL